MKHEFTVMTLKTKQQSTQWYSPFVGTKKARKISNKIRTILTIFIDYEGVVSQRMHHEFRRSINIYIYQRWGVFVMRCIVNGRKIGNPWSGKFTTTMHLPTQPSLCGKL
jgi:hypothetical protein